MSSTTEQVLHRTMAATFEELGLVVPDLEASAEQLAIALDSVVTVSFRGPVSGRLVLRASSNILPELAANMLGSNDGSDAGMQRDALGEIANVICGNLLPKLAGPSTVFMLSAPHWQGEMAGDDSRCSVKARAGVGIDDGRAVAELALFGEGSASGEFLVVAA